jgi:outer membrane protein TolC
MRWTKPIWITALLLAATAGCKQQCFIQESVLDSSVSQLAARLEKMPTASQAPFTNVVHLPTSTILDPDRPRRFVSLPEAISIALENGTRGQGVTGQGVDDLARFQNGAPLISDEIRVLALDPAFAQATMESSLSKFDAIFQNSMTWNTTDRPIGTALDTFQAGRNSALNAIQTDAATFNSSIIKPLPTGGVAGITFSTQYQLTNLPAAVNPSYTPTLQFQFEQPLLQGFGVEINQLLTTHPGSILSPFNFGSATQLSTLSPTQEGILLTRIRYDQSRADFEASVAQMVLNVEQAYWNLYAAYWNLYARELGLRLAYETWRITRDRFRVGGGGAPGGGRPAANQAEVQRTRGQYELFRGQRIDALELVLERERQLRKLLGLEVEDGNRLVPSDSPTLSPYQPDEEAAMNEAVMLRPELVIAREELKVKQLALRQQKNFLLPDLRFVSTYDINSIGTRLDGSENQNAFRNLMNMDFSNWSLGLRMTIPLGFRQAHANVRRAELDIARGAELLAGQERKARSFVAQQYRELFHFYESSRAQRGQREAYQQALRLYLSQVALGIGTVADQNVIDAQRQFADALANEYNAIAQYNNTLAAFEYAKGTLLQHDNIVIAEDDLPHCAKERAVEHHARRSAALVIKEPAAPLPCSDVSCISPDLLPKLPASKPADLPSFLNKFPKTPDEGDVTPVAHPMIELGLPVSPVQTGKPVPPARPENFGASRMLPPSVTVRDSAPSLAPFSGFSSPLQP